MHRHHTRIYEQPINELTDRQLSFIQEVESRDFKEHNPKKRTKKQERRDALIGEVEARIALAKLKEPKPLFPTKNENKEKTVPKTVVNDPSDSSVPSFF
jgi:hypothetical protein